MHNQLICPTCGKNDNLDRDIIFTDKWYCKRCQLTYDMNKLRCKTERITPTPKYYQPFYVTDKKDNHGVMGLERRIAKLEKIYPRTPEQEVQLRDCKNQLIKLEHDIKRLCHEDIEEIHRLKAELRKAEPDNKEHNRTDMEYFWRVMAQSNLAVNKNKKG